MSKICSLFLVLINLCFKTYAYAPTQRDIYDAMGIERGEPSPITVAIVILFFVFVALSQLHDIFFNRIPGYFKKDEMNEKIREYYLKGTIGKLEYFREFLIANHDMGVIYKYFERNKYKLQLWATDIYNYKNAEFYRYCSHKQVVEAIEDLPFTNFLQKIISDIKITAISDYDLIFGQIEIALKFAKNEIDEKQVKDKMLELKEMLVKKEIYNSREEKEYRIEALKKAIEHIEKTFGKNE